MTLNQLVDRIATLFGDSRFRRVTRDQVSAAAVRGYNQFVQAVRMLFEIHLPGDLPNMGSYAYAFEFPYSSFRTNQANQAYFFERNYVRKVGTGDPASIAYAFESVYTSAPCAALMELPETLYQLERATWDGKRLESFSSRAMGIGGLDNQYEQVHGDVYAYLLDKDGNRQLRRYRIPAAAGLHYTYRGRWGMFAGFAPTAVLEAGPRLDDFARMINATTIYPPDVFISLDVGGFSFSLASVSVGNGITSTAPFTGMQVVGSWGVVRRLPGFHPSPRQWGIIRRVVPDSRNTRVEFTRRPHDPRTEGRFEIPDLYLDGVAYWGLSELYKREGPMQDLAMSAHYLARYQNMVGRAKLRLAKVNLARLTVMGGGIKEHRSGPPPLARPPANFPEGSFSRGRRRF